MTKIEAFIAGPPGSSMTITNAPSFGVLPKDISTHINATLIPFEEMALPADTPVWRIPSDEEGS